MNAWPPMLGHLFRRRCTTPEMVEWMRQPTTPASSLPCLDAELKSFWKSRSRASPTSNLLRPSTLSLFRFRVFSLSLTFSLSLPSWSFELLLQGSFLLIRLCSRRIPLEVSSFVAVKRAGSSTTTTTSICSFFRSNVSPGGCLSSSRDDWCTLSGVLPMHERSSRYGLKLLRGIMWIFVCDMRRTLGASFSA